MNTKTLFFALLALVVLPAVRTLAGEPPVLPLWPGVPPGSEGHDSPEKVRLFSDAHERIVSNVHRPSLTVYLPPSGQSTGTAVVILPGGGFRELWTTHEGHNVARFLVAHGIAGIVLQYRLPREEGSTYRLERETLADARRAVQYVRAHAAEWGIDPARIGIVGFSAGGELAALAAARPLSADPASSDPIARVDSHVAFQALIYPGNPGAIKPAKNAPPAFLVCGYGDSPPMVDGLAAAFVRFRQAGVPAELHIYTGVGHGFGIRPSNHTPSATWPDRWVDWLVGEKFVPAKTP